MSAAHKLAAVLSRRWSGVTTMKRVTRLAAATAMASAFFASMAQAQTPPTNTIAAALPQWDYLKMPPRGVPLRLGVLPPDVFKPHTTPGWGLTKICNRIWQDQTGSPERPFAVMYWGNSRFSDTVFYSGMIALDDFIVSTGSSFNRYAQAREYGKGDRGFFNHAEEAALLIAESQAAGMTETNTYWALYLKKLNSSKCGKEKLSDCKRFEAQAELYEFSKSPSDEFLRKADIGKVHIESRCTEKKYQREPFLERPSLIEIILRGLRDD